MILPLLFLIAADACTSVRGPMLLGSDLAAADPQFAAASAEAVLGYAPAPGSRRVLPEAEIARVAQRFGIEAKAHPVCFEYAMQKLERPMILKAIEAALPGAEVEVLETANFTVPEGTVVFPLASLPRPPQSRPDDAVVWRGFIEYAPGRKFTVWARVRIAVKRAYVVFLKDVSAGEEITAANIEIKTVRGFPGAETFAARSEDVVGKRTVRFVRAGLPIPMNALLTGGQAVLRGDTVMVAVEAGAARLRISARAESAAAVGEAVKLRNAKSGKIFEARVTGKDTANLIAAETVQ